MSRHNHYSSNLAVCPYYHYETTQVIYCDGIVVDTLLHLAFANAKQAREYKLDFCKGNYNACSLYQMLEEIDEENDKVPQQKDEWL